jgi:uncharacterized protein YecT (DUF1311 family)
MDAASCARLLDSPTRKAHMLAVRSALALLLLAMLAGPVAAQPDDPHQPTAEERAWLARCLDLSDAGDAAAGRHCAGLLTRACLGHDEAEVPRLRQPQGRNSHPRSCAPIEAALWEELLERWRGEAARAMPPPAREALRRSQRAWISYREASCQVESLVNPGFYGRDLAADCQRDIVAARALDLRRIAAMAREARP